MQITRACTLKAQRLRPRCCHTLSGSSVGGGPVIKWIGDWVWATAAAVIVAHRFGGGSSDLERGLSTGVHARAFRYVAWATFQTVARNQRQQCTEPTPDPTLGRRSRQLIVARSQTHDWRIPPKATKRMGHPGLSERGGDRVQSECTRLRAEVLRNPRSGIL